MASPDGARAAAEFIVNGINKQTDEGLPEAAGQSCPLQAGALFDLQEAPQSR